MVVVSTLGACQKFPRAVCKQDDLLPITRDRHYSGIISVVSRGRSVCAAFQKFPRAVRQQHDLLPIIRGRQYSGIIISHGLTERKTNKK